MVQCSDLNNANYTLQLQDTKTLFNITAKLDCDMLYTQVSYN